MKPGANWLIVPLFLSVIFGKAQTVNRLMQLSDFIDALIDKSGRRMIVIGLI